MLRTLPPALHKRACCPAAITLTAMLALAGCSRQAQPPAVPPPSSAMASAPATPAPSAAVPVAARLEVPKIADVNGVPVFDGYGSALVAKPGSKDRFYLMTDRGPNIEKTPDDANPVFTVPNFHPHIGEFELAGDKLKLVRTIVFKNAKGAELTGLPPSKSGQTPWDVDLKPLPFDEDGIDCEGLVALPDGTFWVSEEYGPDLVHFAADGTTLERIKPGTEARCLPQVLSRRKLNKGLEGLTITPDGKTLIGAMQQSLDNEPTHKPADPKAKLGVTRLIAYDLATGQTRTYAMVHEQDSLSCSELCAVSPTVLLSIDRDSHAPGDAKKPAKVKRIDRVDLSAATDIGDPANGPNGRLFGGLTPEETADEAALRAAGIVPASQTVVLDLLAAQPGHPPYPHGKPEGMCLVAPDLLAVANDSDFGIEGDDGKVELKALPLLGGQQDFTEVVFYRLPAPVH